jgi:hypothetical protein
MSDIKTAIFEIRLCKLVGHDFQGEFAKLAKSYYGDKFNDPHSLKNGGDQGVDGYTIDGTYFQCYSPESNDDSKAAQKMEIDLKKILASAFVVNVPIKKYIFVYNQAKQIPISSNLLILKDRIGKANGIEATIWTFSDITNELFNKLSHSQAASYLGMHGKEETFKHDVMHGIYTHIKNRGVGGEGLFTTDSTRQDFVEKIEYNKFDDAWRSFWECGIKHDHDVTEYFKSRKEEQEVCFGIITKLYAEKITQHNDSNEIVKNMVLDLTDDIGKPENFYHIAYILVYYFKNCSIFKSNK